MSGRRSIQGKEVYQANLNYRTVKPYLDTLILIGFLEVIDGPIILYRTTEKGNEALERLKEVDALIL